MRRSIGPVRGLVFVVAAVVLLVAACGSEPGEAVLAFEEIAVAGPEVTLDPSGTAASITVDTSIDAVCAVSYGEDGPSGRIATDREMDPGGHTAHRVTLTGLVPGTEYQFRLQGVGADGGLYRSDGYTFRTPEPPPSAWGENVAAGAEVIDVSSEFSATFAAVNAVDGDLGTEWSTAGDGDDAYIVLDLGRQVEVAAVRFRTRQMGDGTAITETFVVATDDGVRSQPLRAGPEPVAVELSGRVLRFEVVESTGGNTGAVEIEVYEEAGPEG